MFSQGSTCLDLLWIPPCQLIFRLRGFHPLWPAFPKPFFYHSSHLSQSITPECTHSGLGSFHFARRYFGNRVFFLFLRVLRCFSSPGSPHAPMYSVHADGGMLRRVSPFRYLRINGYLLLPEAFRSLLRLSSALSAKASTLRSLLLDHHKECSVNPYGSRFVFKSFLSSIKSITVSRDVLGCLFPISLAYDVYQLS